MSISEVPAHDTEDGLAAFDPMVTIRDFGLMKDVIKILANRGTDRNTAKKWPRVTGARCPAATGRSLRRGRLPTAAIAILTGLLPLRQAEFVLLLLVDQLVVIAAVTDV